jgi:hypothetical protein
MSDLTLPAPMLSEPPRRDRWIVWTALASVMLHAGVVAFVLWQPVPPSAEAAEPPAIDVELVPPPEAVSASKPPSEESAEEASGEPATAPPAETASAEPPPPEQVPAPSAAEASAPEVPAEAEALQTASEAADAAAQSAPEAADSAASDPPQGSEAAAKVAPIPLTRPVRGLAASASGEGASALTADTGETAEGTAPAASAEPDVASLELGPPRNAERFYLEAMLSAPSMARARAMLETLPHEKRLAQTCNIEALAQIGNSGEGFAPDVVMAEAYALSEMTGTRLTASGAIFRSQERWYGVAFDCTLSDDLTSVTAFSYRLGADVTEAVLARLEKN